MRQGGRHVSGFTYQVVACWVGVMLAWPARAQTHWRVFGEAARAAVVQALDVLNLTTNDPGFTKDVAEPRWALSRVRALLAHPLELPALADEAVDVAVGAVTEECLAVRRWLELADAAPEATAGEAAPIVATNLDARLVAALDAFVRTAGGRAQALTGRAFAGISMEDRVYAAASLLGGTFLIDDYPELRPRFAAAGISEAVTDNLLAEDAALNPDPAVARYLGVCTNTQLGDLCVAAEILQAAVTDLMAACAGVDWPERVTTLETVAGRIVVGTPGVDLFDTGALLILDPGGDDLYRGAAGSANGLLGREVGVVVDLGGDDRYTGDGLLGPGAALFGVALMMDMAGADVHRDAHVGAGAGLFGVARVEDASGDDQYQALGLAQGAGVVGVGILRDRAGQDRYDLGHSGQGFAGVRGVGLLIDGAGNDRYSAGGHRVDWDRNEGRFLSMAQGFAIGMRPFAGGGMAALIDLDGNDAYEADVYGQGVGYWYAVGMLIDRRGEDTYQLFQYGQGAGIHLSLGLLADGGGRDSYTGNTLCQGTAHDYAVGLLLDHDGDDTYVGDHFVQGLAINNSFALLLDAAGSDAYFARQPDRAQGIGDNGSDREYGSLSLLLDLAGADRYTCGAADGLRFARPDIGIVYDVPEVTNAPAAK